MLSFSAFTKVIVCLHLESGECNEGTVRLVNGTLTREGRLEVCDNGVWGSVCGRNFRKSAAYVACKQSGFHDVNGKYLLFNLSENIYPKYHEFNIIITYVY